MSFSVYNRATSSPLSYCKAQILPEKEIKIQIINCTFTHSFTAWVNNFSLKILQTYSIILLFFENLPENPSLNLHFVWLVGREDLKWDVRSWKYLAVLGKAFKKIYRTHTLKLPSRNELNLFLTLIFSSSVFCI